MRCYLNILLLFLTSLVQLHAQTLEEGPWYNQYLNSLRRIPARATSYSYSNEEDGYLLVLSELMKRKTEKE